jgi:hypothetical protein
MGSGRWAEGVEGACDILNIQLCRCSNEAQQKRLVQTINSARSIQSMAQQASAYNTATTLPASLPGYVNLDQANDWISSALVATAIETVTLPSRFRPLGGRQASLSLLEDILNPDGRQNIFELTAGVPRRSLSNQNHVGSADEGTPSISNGHTEIPHADSSQAEPGLEIKYATELPGRLQGPSPHMFSQALIQRGIVGNSDVVGTTEHNVGAGPIADAVVEK